MEYKPQIAKLQEDKEWQKQFIPEIERIIRECSHCIISIRIANDDEDYNQGTDFVVTVKGGEIAVRLRRPSCTYRDLTIRSRRKNGSKTELEKVREGASRWYLYGWTVKNSINQWIFVDMDKMRSSGLIYLHRTEIPNKDGTAFVKFTLDELLEIGSLLNCSSKEWCPC